MNENTIPGISIHELRKPKKPASRVPCLVIYNTNDHMDHIFPLEKNSVVIGRGAQCDIKLETGGISRQHARIDLHENSYVITDLQSLNGTIVNDAQIQQSALKEGDKVMIGETEFRFCYLSQDHLEFQSAYLEKTTYDHLTNVANKTFFIEMLRREVGYAIRQGNPLSCIMLDIDHLQAINHKNGINAGDTVLRKIALSLSEGLRSYDLLCRYGGEEFVILLRDTALDNALTFSDRIRSRIEALRISFEGLNLNVTVSIGVSHLNPDHIQDAMDIVREADRHLQTAKKQGGNKVCSIRTQI